jgi:23S rRNA pseudouridine2605 synthase
MRAWVTGIAVCMTILGLGGACSAGGPSGKAPCHCAQNNGCHCPLPPPAHAANKPAGPAHANRTAHMAGREAHIARHARRMAHRERRSERWEAWVEKRERRTAHREATMERHEVGAGRGREHFRFYRGFAAQPYGYRSTSRRFAMHEGFRGPRMQERFAMEEHTSRGGYPGGYSEEGYGGPMSSGGPDGYDNHGYGPPPRAGERNHGPEDHYADEGPGASYGDEGPGPGYGDEGPGYGSGGEGYAAGYSSGVSMSINSAAALDSWHGYGVECPPYE